jgi:alkylation response protein AidB-like acyl-CoA dehydrogenase
MSVPDLSREALLDVARSLGPVIRASAPAADRNRALPTPLFEELADRGFYRLLVPRSLGGYELDLPTYIAILGEVARHDGSTGWCLSQANGYSMISAYLNPLIARSIYDANPRTYVANGQGPARATIVPGGYRVSGRWSFSSGLAHATRLAGICPLYDGDSPRRLADGSAETREMLFPPSVASVADVWDVAGLRGTGSQQFAVDDLFVPSDFTVSTVTDEPLERGALYCFPRISVFASGFGSVALGVARGALDSFAEMAGAKVPRGAPAPLRDQPVVQADFARAEAIVRSGRAYLHHTVSDIWDAVERCGALTIAQRSEIRLAATHVIHLAAEAVDVVYRLAGSTAIYQSWSLQRQFQDIHVITQHVQGRAAHYESVGRHILGLDPDFQWL